MSFDIRSRRKDTAAGLLRTIDDYENVLQKVKGKATPDVLDALEVQMTAFDCALSRLQSVVNDILKSQPRLATRVGQLAENHGDLQGRMCVIRAATDTWRSDPAGKTAELTYHAIEFLDHLRRHHAMTTQLFFEATLSDIGGES